MTLVKHWNRLLEDDVDAPFLELLKFSLNGALSNLQGGLDWMIFTGPFQHKPFYNSVML